MLKEFVYSEEQLVESLKRNQRDGFEYFYDHYAPAVFGIIRKLVIDEEIAATVTEETFLEFWRTIQSYKVDDGTVFTRILHIARNKAQDYYICNRTIG